MGVDCQVTLPAKARIRDVADVLAILHGCEVVRDEFKNGGWHAEVMGVKVEGIANLPECATIKFAGHRFLYHFEFGSDGMHGIMPRSTASNICAMVKLAEFFGGRVGFSDCDCREEQPYINATDGDEWERLQMRKLAVQPMSKFDIQAYEQFAAYKAQA